MVDVFLAVGCVALRESSGFFDYLGEDEGFCVFGLVEVDAAFEEVVVD